jgi:hypothetical protein
MAMVQTSGVGRSAGRVVLLSLVAVVAYVLLALRVETDLTDEDVAAIGVLGVGPACDGVIGDFESELSCLRAIQTSVLAIGDDTCGTWADRIEPASFIERGYGCCFDRSRFIEKAARHYGFETRHLFMIVPKWGLSITNVLPLGQSSHAASEILTSRGWLGIDSVHPFILVDGAGNVHTYRSALASGAFEDVMVPSDFFSSDVDVIVGMYSRHGFFYAPKLPGPEFAFDELRFNFVGD